MVSVAFRLCGHWHCAAAPPLLRHLRLSIAGRTDVQDVQNVQDYIPELMRDEAVQQVGSLVGWLLGLWSAV